MRKLFILLILIVTSCGSKLENVYDIVVEQEIPDIKLSLTIYIPERFNEVELEELAENIYDKYNGDDYENVFMIYLLPDMEKGNGAYASSHYNPNLDLVIYELTEEEVLAIKNKFEISHRAWVDRKLLFEIKSKQNKYFIESYGDDFSTGKKYLNRKVQGKDTIYWDPTNEHGDYYILDSSNNLSVHDNRGYILTYSKP